MGLRCRCKSPTLSSGKCLETHSELTPRHLRPLRRFRCLAWKVRQVWEVMLTMPRCSGRSRWCGLVLRLRRQTPIFMNFAAENGVNCHLVLPGVCRLTLYGCMPTASRGLQRCAVWRGLLAVERRRQRQGILVVPPIAPGQGRQSPSFPRGCNIYGVKWSSLPCQQLGEENAPVVLKSERRREPASPSCRVGRQHGT